MENMGKNKVNLLFFWLLAGAVFVLALACENPFIDHVLQPRTVSFNSNGGSSVSSQVLYRGERAVRPADPQKEENEFLGWFSDNVSFLNEWDFSTQPSGDITLFAKWSGMDVGFVISNVNVNIPAPVMGSVPAGAASVNPGVNYSAAGSIIWNPAHDIFEEGVQYSATVTVDALGDYTFSSMPAATVNGFIAAIVTSAAETSVTLNVTFPATAGRVVTGIEIITQPNTLTYTHGNPLVLTGLSARLIYNDLSFLNVALSDFAQNNITTSPGNGTQLSRLSHNGHGVYAVYNNSNIRAATGALTVNPKPVTITGVAAQNREYNSAVTVALTGGVLQGIETFDDGNVSFILGTGTIENANAANNKSVTTGISLTGNAASNYTLTQPAGITVNITPALITSAALSVTPPASNQAPSSVVYSSGHYSASLTWLRENGDPTDAAFTAGARYAAHINLGANENYNFAAGFTATINGESAEIESVTGTSVSLKRLFAPTPDKSVIAISVLSQPSNLTYTHGNPLNLNGLSVQLFYSDASFENVSLAQFSARSIVTSPANGASLVRANHNNRPVTVSYGATAIRTFTNDLEIDKAAGESVNVPSPATSDGAVFTVSVPALFGGQNIEHAISTNQAAAAGSLTWQPNPEFTLAPNAAAVYYWYWRSAENDNFNAGAMERSGAISFFTVTFDSNGGNYTPAAQVVFNGRRAAVPNPPVTRTGFGFNNWINSGAPWNFVANTVTANVVLTAEWIANQSFNMTFEMIRDLAPDVIVTPDTPLTFSQSGAAGFNTGLELSLPVTPPAGFTYGNIQWHHNSHQIGNQRVLIINNTDVSVNAVGNNKIISVTVELIPTGGGTSQWYSRQIYFNVTN